MSDFDEMPLIGLTEWKRQQRLRDASPAMLEALRFVEWMVQDKADADVEGSNDEMKILVAVREAIRKATGEEP